MGETQKNSIERAIKISYHKIRNFRYFSLQWLQLRFYAEDCKSTIICTEDQLISFNRSSFFDRVIFLYYGSSIVNLFSNKFKNYVKRGYSTADK